MRSRSDAVSLGQPDLRYLAHDRRREWLGGRPVPDYATGALLFADVAGFTALSQRLMQRLGSQRGAEEITRLLNALYESLIVSIHQYGGEVITFGGDSLTCWFAGDSGLQAIACGLALQARMQQHPPAGGSLLMAPLSLRVAVAHGTVRRLYVGDPTSQSFDVLAGAPLDQLRRTEQHTTPGEVCLDAPLARALVDHLTCATLASTPDTLRVVALQGAVIPPTPIETLDLMAVAIPSRAASWLPSAVSERLEVEEEMLLAETRPVAVLFLSFAGLDYDAEPEAATKLDQVVRWVQRVLGPYESSVLHVAAGDKGSHLYTAFGAPLAHDDDPRRALAAALVLQRLPAELPFVRDLRIGLNWGQVRAGIYGSSTRRTYGLLGDVVNLAARLMTAAAPGEILVGPALARLAPAPYVLVAVGTLTLKGMQGGIAVHRLVGASDAPFSEQSRRPGGATPSASPRLVGRASEQAQLLSLLEGALNGQGRIVILEGEAGLGKSRLVQELVREGEHRGVLSAVGQGSQVGTAPYAAWQPLVRALLELGPGLSVEAQRTRVYDTLSVRAPHLRERTALLSPLLGFSLPETALTQGLEGGVRQQALQALMGELVRAALAIQPLLLVLEDAQWLDDLSRELALSLAWSLAAEPLPFLLLLVTRPMGDTDPLRAVWEGLQPLRQGHLLSVQPLEEEEVSAVGASLLGVPRRALPTFLVDLLQRRSGGNPMVIEALLATLAEQGRLQVVSHGERVTVQLSDSLTDSQETVPETLYGLVLARLDRLTAAQQAILRVASVLGSSEEIRALQAGLLPVARLGSAQVAQGLDDLARLKLLMVDKEQRRYTFTQPLVQEVVYQTLLFEQRRALHQAVAVWYETTYAEAEGLEPHYTRLAYHYQAAEESEGERHYARLAGEQAARLFANRAACQYLTRALALTPPDLLAEQYSLLAALERVHDVLGDRAAQQSDLQALTRLASRLRQPTYRTHTLVRRAQYALVTGDPYLVREALQELTLLSDRSALTGEDTADNLVRGYIIWGRLLAQQGEYVEAARRLWEALRWAKATSQPRVEIDAHLALGSLAEKAGQLQEAQTHYQQALQLAEAQQDMRRAGEAWLRLGQRAYQQAQYEEARRCYQEALQRTRTIGDVQAEGRTLIDLAWVLVDQGDYPLARSYLRQVLALCRSLHDQEGEILAWRCSAYQAFTCGLYARATRHTQAVLALAQPLGRQEDVAWALENLGLVAHYQGYPEQARTWADQALAVARAIGAPRRQGFALTLLGHALLALGDWEEAAAAYEEACTIRAGLQERDLLAESRAGLAAVALRADGAQQALPHVEDLLEEMALSPFYGADDVCQIFLVCHDVLHALGDERADPLLEQAHLWVQRRAISLQEPRLQKLYWTEVPTHRRLRVLYEAVYRVGQGGLEAGA